MSSTTRTKATKPTKPTKPGRTINDPTAKAAGPPIARLFQQHGELPRSMSRTEAVHEALRLAILEQRLKPGAKLPEDAIGEAFGTSRTIAREALGRLAVEGIVELKQNRGAFVANPSLEEGQQTFFVRRGLERLVTDTLAGRIRKKDIAHLRETMAQERSVVDRDPREAIRLAGEFHIVLARMSGNQILSRFVSEVVCRCSLVLAMYGRPHSAECGVTEHEAIVDALAEGSGPKASQLMDDHIAAVAERAFLNKRIQPDNLSNLLAPYAARLKE